jgi:hypothetical protein
MIGVASPFPTWNGLTLTAAPPVTTLDTVTRFFAFSGANGPGDIEGVYFNSVLPSSYTDGVDIKITLIATSNDTGNFRFYVGLVNPNAGAYGVEVDTEYVGVTTAGSVGFNIQKIVFTFSGTNFVAGDPLPIKIYRNSADAADTMVSDAYINTVIIEEV